MDYNCHELHLQHHLQHKSPHFRIPSLVLLFIIIPTLAADDFPRIDPLGKQMFTYTMTFQSLLIRKVHLTDCPRSCICKTVNKISTTTDRD